ncbi:MAG: hypothetical protein DYG97_05125, partial [Ignavibacteria bacterium CHB3]|nr:hypothetical protein [Ignavibacteria bacterium CHB3]
MLSEKFSITRTLILLTVVFLVFNFDNAQSQKSESESVIDSDLNFEEAVAGISVPDGTIENLRIVDIYYYGFDDKLHKGQLVVHKDVVLDIIEIFEFIRESHFPVEKVIPI